MNRGKALSALALSPLGIALLAPVPATAQEISDDWQFTAMIYGWLPDIAGNSAFRGDTGFEVDVSTILDHLKMGALGDFEMQKGHWGAFTDVIYLDVGDTASRTRDLTIDNEPLPATVTARLDFDLKVTIWTLGGSYRLIATPDATFDVLVGARLIDMKQELGWELSADIGGVEPPPRTGRRDSSASNWDGIVGAKGRFLFGADRKWAVPYYLDVGTGDSDLTWQGALGLAYAFDWGSVGAGWRYLDYELKSGAPIDNINFNGPVVGVSFRW